MKLTNRREILATLSAFGGLLFLGTVLNPASKGTSRDEVEAIAGPTVIARSNMQGYAGLKALDLGDPEIIVRQKNMPVGKIGSLYVGRRISGGIVNGPVRPLS